eukprot:UN10104
MDEIDDRKYDDELLMYERQVVITKRSNTIRHSSLFRQSWNLPDIQIMESTLPQWLESESMTPRNQELYGNNYGRRASPYYRANRFEHNEKITDRSLRDITDIISVSLSPTTSGTSTLTTPKFEQMTTTDITESDFTNAQMDKYMKKMYKTKKPKTDK